MHTTKLSYSARVHSVILHRLKSHEPGVTVDPRWQGEKGLNAFVEDMGPPPFIGCYLVRRDWTLGYSKENCMWVDPLQYHKDKPIGGYK